ncbi:DNA mismatch repair protein MutS [Kordia sp. YSTF-M3]|uniref:DNA mismatch repair protein MutS n=1 Tax=Kordia aestuariivivens TaxID=2759037 RepID=A0ABR7Q7Z0_9FLAO|nr:DNA mismatch repair protein MutS [Kordia aestuariivivens]MBC8754444.1 DNA mismatch repair protein MutS [Kordia aestuariivivens]
MQEPITFYQSQKAKFEAELKVQKRKLNQSSVVRLIVFLSIAFAIYLFFGQWNYVIISSVIGIGIFLYLVFRHADLVSQKNKLEALIQCNQIEIDVINGDLSKLPTGEEFLNAAHEYSYDIDLFGNASFFQYLNRATTREGKNELADLLASNKIENISSRQEAIKELAQKGDWRQHFSAIALLIKVETSSKSIINWLGEYKSFIPKAIRYLPMIFSALSIAVITLVYLEIIPFLYAILWIGLGLGITGKFLKSINQLSNNTNKAKDTFQQYGHLLNRIEATTFTSKLLQEKQQNIHSEVQKASTLVREFSKRIDALDNRNNILVGIFLNGLLLWDISKSYQIEIWIGKHSKKVAQWFEVVTFFDAYNSLGNFAFNHPQFVYPTITEQGNQVLDAKKLGHPLLRTNNRIDNDFNIGNAEFFIITGANMAGKSTFLRTVSLSIVMANTGLPICATTANYSPIKLITSMRTTDSLAEGASYFFSELQRLKMIVDRIKDDTYFIILDEILKGTNSHDKAMGSKKIVQKLASQNAAGIIATHDLSLCELEKDISQVKNYFFDAEIINDELFFGYLLKKGICSNMNASFLLKKMEIVE